VLNYDGPQGSALFGGFSAFFVSVRGNDYFRARVSSPDEPDAVFQFGSTENRSGWYPAHLENRVSRRESFTKDNPHAVLGRSVEKESVFLRPLL
jgi:hypothetical protein